jgi:hypothetical protein
MNNKNRELKEIEIIKIQFNDPRKIIGKADAELQDICEKHGVYGEIYETENHELIVSMVLDEDFTNKVLEKLIKFGEDLYKTNNKIVSIYILGSPHSENRVTKEIMESHAEIIVKFTKMEYSDAYDIYWHIRGLVDNNIKLNKDDLFALSMVPTMGPPEDKRNLRIECLKIWKEVVNKGMIE